MKLGKAIERLLYYFQEAEKCDWVIDKVAWALYQTWKEADEKRVS